MAKYITMSYCRRVNWRYCFNPQVEWRNRRRWDWTNHKTLLLYDHLYFNKYNLIGFHVKMLLRIQNISVCIILLSSNIYTLSFLYKFEKILNICISVQIIIVDCEALLNNWEGEIAWKCIPEKIIKYPQYVFFYRTLHRGYFLLPYSPTAGQYFARLFRIVCEVIWKENICQLFFSNITCLSQMLWNFIVIYNFLAINFTLCYWRIFNKNWDTRPHAVPLIYSIIPTN